MGHERVAVPDEDREVEREMLAAIHEQGRQTYELVRALIALLTPAEGGRDGPTLEELLAKIMAQQKEIIDIGKQTQTDLDALGAGLPDAVVEALEGRRSPRS